VSSPRPVPESLALNTLFRGTYGVDSDDICIMLFSDECRVYLNTKFNKILSAQVIGVAAFM